MTDGLWKPRGTTARNIVLAAMAVNLVATVMMATVMRRATAAGGEGAERMAYIAAHARAVSLGWYEWELATLSLVTVFVVMLRSIESAPSGLRLLSFAAVCMGAIPDSINNLIGGAIVPEIARAWVKAGGDPTLRAALAMQFRSWDRMSVVLTGGLANALYAAAGWLLLAACWRVKGYPQKLKWLQVALWAATTAMSASAFAESIPGLVVSVGAAMVLFLAWTVGSAFLWLT